LWGFCAELPWIGVLGTRAGIVMSSVRFLHLRLGVMRAPITVPVLPDERPVRVSRPVFDGELFVGSLSSFDGDGWLSFHSVEFLDFAWWQVVE
jgi:hypothetical protein